MFKKLIVTGAAAALMLSAAAGAFASEEHHSLPTTTVSISNEGAVSNNVETSANTGYNDITGGSVSGSSILTGAAAAGSDVQTQLNWNQFDCGCLLGIGDKQNLSFSLSNSGEVENMVSTDANTGFNSISAGGIDNYSFLNNEDRHDHGMSNGVSDSSITTGAANASSVIKNVVNTNMFGSLSL